MDFAITPSGQSLVTSGSCNVTRINLVTGAKKELYRGHESDCLYTFGALDVSPDGRFASGSLGMMSGIFAHMFDAIAGGPPSWLK